MLEPRDAKYGLCVPTLVLSPPIPMQVEDQRHFPPLFPCVFVFVFLYPAARFVNLLNNYNSGPHVKLRALRHYLL